MRGGGHILLLWFLLLPTACARLPQIEPARFSPTPAGERCVGIFPRGDWQLLHAIEATPPAGGKQTMLGLSQLFPGDQSLHCIMMTLEGMVLFEARYDDTISVQRAVPPFDRPGMAEGIIEDMRLIFFAPAGPPETAGRAANGATICRYRLADGTYQDIEIGAGGDDWIIRKYGPHRRVTRTVRPAAAAGISEDGLPNRILLEAPGLAGYQLTISLLEATPLAVEGSPADR